MFVEQRRRSGAGALGEGLGLSPKANESQEGSGVEEGQGQMCKGWEIPVECELAGRTGSKRRWWPVARRKNTGWWRPGEGGWMRET